MSVSFLYPHMLWLLLLLPILWAVTLALVLEEQHQELDRTATRRDLLPFTLEWFPRQPLHRRVKLRWSVLWRRIPARTWVSLTLRIILLIAIIFSLAGTRFVQHTDDMAVVFLVDGSDSVTPEQRTQTLGYINATLEHTHPNDQAAVVLFGEQPSVERAPGKLEALPRLTSQVSTNRTNIAEAIRLGLALLPSDTQQRLVLLSDGGENLGKATDAAQVAVARDVPVDTLMLAADEGQGDVILSALEAPTAAHIGQQITLQAAINSSIETQGTLYLFADGELVEERQVAIGEGFQEEDIAVLAEESGFHRYEARIEADNDTRAMNNRAAAFTTVEGPPHILIAASEPDQAAPLKSVFEAANATVDVVSPQALPADQPTLRQYTAVVFVNVAAYDTSFSVIEALPTYIREQGGSFMMVGGQQSFGAGGWRRSPIEEMLPVELDRKDTVMRPDLALVLVMDRSGSMAEQSTPAALTKLDLAKEAVYQASLGLEEQDKIGIVAFDTFGSWILPIQRLPDTLEIQDALSRFVAGGGTDIRSGIAPAARELSTVDAKVKHVLLLTDGQADSNYADLVDQMQQQGTTISVVAIGQNSNPELEEIAKRGGGRHYLVEQASDVPSIFLSETIIVAGRDIEEEPFTPLVSLPAPVVRGVGDFPPLYGYNVTEAREAARTILVSPDGKPVLAQWQYGLGRSVVWTSDLKAQWAEEWITWGQFPSFGEGLLAMLMPPKQNEGVTLEAHTKGGQMIFDLMLEDRTRAQEDLMIQGRLLDPEDKGATLSFTQVGAGHYRAVKTASDPGIYLAQVAALERVGGQLVGMSSTGLVVTYSPEYSTAQQNPDLMQNIASLTGGRYMPEPDVAFARTQQDVGVVKGVSLPLLWLVVGLWPLDIAIRRLLLRKDDLRGLRTWLANRILRRKKQRTSSQPAPRDESMERLFAARERAQHRGRRWSSEEKEEHKEAEKKAGQGDEESGGKED